MAITTLHLHKSSSYCGFNFAKGDCEGLCNILETVIYSSPMILNMAIWYCIEKVIKRAMHEFIPLIKIGSRKYRKW